MRAEAAIVRRLVAVPKPPQSVVLQWHERHVCCIIAALSRSGVCAMAMRGEPIGMCHVDMRGGA